MTSRVSWPVSFFNWYLSSDTFQHTCRTDVNIFEEKKNMPRRNTQNAQITRVNYEVCLANLLGRRFNFNDVASNCSEIFSSGRFERDLCLIWINIISARGDKRFLIVAILIPRVLNGKLILFNAQRFLYHFN